MKVCRPQDSGRGQESIAAEIQQMSESLSAKKVGIGLRRVCSRMFQKI